MIQRYRDRNAGGVAYSRPPFVPRTLTLYIFGYLEDESGDIVEKSGGAKPFWIKSFKTDSLTLSCPVSP